MECLDEDALLCDMAETYGIYDLESLPVLTIAKLACGLRANSRIRCKQAGLNVTFDTFLMGMICDQLNWLAWTHTKDGQHNRNRPKRFADSMLAHETEPREKIVAFDSPEDFLAARAKLLGGD